MPALNSSEYYRLPWSMTDNVLAWLEPTKRCNLACEGCYSRNEKQYDKTLDQIRSDLEVFRKNRRFDSVSIAGGDPLMHEDIVEIVRLIRDEYGFKPILNTNGHALTRALVKDLKRAGLFGFTFHVDSKQHRPGHKHEDDVALNALRLEYAQMVAEAGGMSVAFNATIYPDTKHHVPELMAWAREHIDIVQSMVFILYRTTRARELDYFALGQKIDPQELIYDDEAKLPAPLTADEIVSLIREHDPLYQPSAYLGGTKDPASFKWLLAGRIGDPGKIHGYVGPRFMEFAQTAHHLLTGRYVAYSSPALLHMGRMLMAGGALVDGGIRRALAHWGTGIISAPWRVARRAHFQSIAIIQPIDFLPDGEMNMCDGCPDMTVHRGQLVWSCRLDERLQYGCFLTAAPKNHHAQRLSASPPVPLNVPGSGSAGGVSPPRT